MATISYLRLLETMSGGDYHVFTMSRPVVPMSVPTSAFFSLHKNNERISIKFEQVGPTYTTNRWIDYILGEIAP